MWFEHMTFYSQNRRATNYATLRKSFRMDGIRTHGIKIYNDLANQRFKPLSHHSLIREKRDLNPRLLTWQINTLTTELFSQKVLK